MVPAPPLHPPRCPRDAQSASPTGTVALDSTALLCRSSEGHLPFGPIGTAKKTRPRGLQRQATRDQTPDARARARGRRQDPRPERRARTREPPTPLRSQPRVLGAQRPHFASPGSADGPRHLGGNRPDKTPAGNTHFYSVVIRVCNCRNSNKHRISFVYDFKLHFFLESMRRFLP